MSKRIVFNWSKDIKPPLDYFGQVMQTIIMKSLLTLIIVFLAVAPALVATSAERRPLVIAVLDSGFGYQNLGHDAKLCRFGHKDFTSDNVLTKDYATAVPVPVDFIGHGTNIVGLIGQQIPRVSNYCVVVIKIYNARGHPGDAIQAIRYARNIHADYLNYSGGGEGSDYDERQAVESYIGHGGRFIAAAGNEGKDLMKQGYYPAMYPGVVSVGNLTRTREINPYSNYGLPVTRWEVGTKREAWGLVMTGTSQATAVATGKMVAEALQ